MRTQINRSKILYFPNSAKKEGRSVYLLDDPRLSPRITLGFVVG